MRGLSLSAAPTLARDIKALSDHFTSHEGSQTPWDLWAAYMVYFFPLNVVRLRSVLEESFRNFPWNSVFQIIDFGSGPGTVHAALEASEIEPRKILAIELDARAIALHKALELKKWQCDWKSEIPKKIESGTLGIFSYSILEEERVNARLHEFDHLLIVTPSTQMQGRKLLEIRKKLMTDGYSSWAPCTHQLACPLLSQSAHDWCHDRIAFDAPGWFKQLESHLPNYNHTLTFSYWFASRTQKPQNKLGSARVIGDTLFEKGKIRQMICRGPNREFLAWLTRHGEPDLIPRGTLYDVPPDIEIKGNELRPKK